MTGGLRDVAGDSGRLGREPVALEAQGDDAVVVWPHGSQLIGKRVVSGVTRGQRANAPAAPHIGLKEASHHALGMVRAGDSAPQAMPRVRGYRRHRLLVGI